MQVRECLVSEALFHLNVSTTRCLSLVVSQSETVRRYWFKNDSLTNQDKQEVMWERTAISARASPSFMRVGQVELFSRRARATGRETDKRELRMLVEHLLQKE